LWLGWVWLDAGLDKVTDSAWVGADAPVAINGFLSNAISPEMTEGEFPPVAGWYADLTRDVFLPIDGFLSYAIAFGQVAVGVGLILGAFTMAAAFFGALMSLNFMLAGSLGTSENPIMLTLQLLILFAGAATYVYGADRFLMPWLRRRLARPTPAAPAPASTGVLDPAERGVRAVLAIALLLLAWGFGFSGVEGIGFLVLAAISLATAATGRSPFDLVVGPAAGAAGSTARSGADQRRSN
jgi:thiosulfate dehydrogenase (quinone) large subunit